MSVESPWDSTRWRDALQTPRYEHLQHHPQLAAPAQPAPGTKDPLAQPWYGTSTEAPPQQHYSYDSRRPSQTYGNQLSQHAQPERHPQSGDYGPSNSTNPSNARGYPARDGPPYDHGHGDRTSGERLLSLQIPHSKPSELPGITHGYTTPRSDAPPYSSGMSSWSHHTPALPSFAALSEQASRMDEPDEVEIAPMSARLSCTQCTKVTPLIREAATAVAELDGNVQSLCNASGSRSLDVPNEGIMRTVQWILDRVRYAKQDMQDVARSGVVEQNRSQLPSAAYYPNPLKRGADQWEQDDMPALKLPRPSPSQTDTFSGDRRTSIDFAARDPIQRSAYSPAPSDSAPGSAYPRQGSPTSGRLPRALPSPSSLAFAQPGSASFVPANAASIGSPGTSYHPGSSIHTVSTSSATSAHLQDLQHQVSLKSLALQTLQTEYATLLQKLQRERIKIQTIEKKTTVADQEVNDLTTRNEELSEQIKTLESQLQECERKREAERADAAKEKDQWGRMLDMSGRLQSKSAADQQRLVDEKADLLRRLGEYKTSQTGPVNRPSPPSGQSARNLSVSTPTSGAEASSGRHGDLAPSRDDEALRQENATLQARVATLSASLENIRRQYGRLEQSLQELLVQKDLLRQSFDTSTQDEALHMEAGGNKTGSSGNKPGSHMAAPNAEAAYRHTEKSPPGPATMTSTVPEPTQNKSALADPFSRETLAHIARAISPGPAELGFDVQPSTSSPEELIKALGPVPAPLPAIRYSSPFEDHIYSAAGGSKQKRRQSQPFVAPLNLPHEHDTGLPQLPSFRPLSHQMPAHHRPLAQSSGTSPHSHHSSPGANLSNTSSPGSASTQSPEWRIAGRHEHAFARRHSQPHLQFATSPSTTAMPPPPRPFP